jgi:hypothetical protein
MYEAHAARSEPDSTDWAILSPHVPVFCSDAGSLLERLWSESFITSAAAYAPYGPAPGGRLLDHRIRRVLDVAPAHGYSALVVGRGAAAPSATTPTERPRTSGDTSMSCQTLSNMWSLSSLTGPTTAGTWGHSPRRSEPPLADEWPPEGLGTQVSGRDPTTGAAGEPAPVRPQGRPSVPDPRAAAPRARAPERPAGHQARGVPAGRPGTSPSPGTPTSSSARCTRPATRLRDGGSPSASSPRSQTARVPEVARLGRGRALRQWKAHVLARFRHPPDQQWRHRGRQPHHREDPTARPRLRTFEHHRLRILLAASGTRPYRELAPVPSSEEPSKGTDVARLGIWAREALETGPWLIQRVYRVS